jgi:hypothetical protein
VTQFDDFDGPDFNDEFDVDDADGAEGEECTPDFCWCCLGEGQDGCECESHEGAW